MVWHLLSVCPFSSLPDDGTDGGPTSRTQAFTSEAFCSWSVRPDALTFRDVRSRRQSEACQVDALAVSLSFTLRLEGWRWVYDSASVPGNGGATSVAQRDSDHGAIQDVGDAGVGADIQAASTFRSVSSILAPDPRHTREVLISRDGASARWFTLEDHHQVVAEIE